MQILTATLFSLGMLASATLLYRSLRWSLDSPVLRRALRSRKFSRITWCGIATVTVLSILTLARIGARAWDPGTLFFAGMMMLFGWLGVMFASLLLEDVREVFYVATGRSKAPLERWREPHEPLHLALDEGEPTCRAETTCHEQLAACGPGGIIPARRPASRRRTGQHR